MPPSASDDPFSAASARYDELFASLPGVDRLRVRILRLAQEGFPAGGHVLELGCGTGDDALWLAAHGFRVTASDISEGMVRVAEAKARSSGLPVEFRRLDASKLDDLPGGLCDAIFSNFGPLNCIDELPAFFGQAHRILTPGGSMLACLLGRVSPWEIASFMLCGRRAEALRRLRHGPVPVPVANRSVQVRFFSSSAVRSSAKPYFLSLSSEGLNSISPPPTSSQFIALHPRLSRALWSIESRIGDIFPFSIVGDHVAFLFRRRP